MVIAATRLYRSLVDFASSSTDVYDILYSLAIFGSLWMMSFQRMRGSTRQLSCSSELQADDGDTNLNGSDRSNRAHCI